MTRDKADLAVFRALYESFCFSYRSPRKFTPCDTVAEKGLIFWSLQCSCYCCSYAYIQVPTNHYEDKYIKTLITIIYINANKLRINTFFLKGNKALDVNYFK